MTLVEKWESESMRSEIKAFAAEANIWLRHFNTSTPIWCKFIWFLRKFRSSSLRPVITVNDREILRETSTKEFELLIAPALEDWITNRLGKFMMKFFISLHHSQKWMKLEHIVLFHHVVTSASNWSFSNYFWFKPKGEIRKMELIKFDELPVTW